MYNNWDMIIDSIDEELINHAAETMAKNKKTSFKPIKIKSIAGTAAAIAACLCIAVGGIIIANGGFSSSLTGGSTVIPSGEPMLSETTEDTQYTTTSVEVFGGYPTEEILLIYIEQSNTVEELYQKIYSVYKTDFIPSDKIDLIPSVSVYKDDSDYKNGIEILEGDLENGMIVFVAYNNGESYKIKVQGKESVSEQNSADLPDKNTEDQTTQIESDGEKSDDFIEALNIAIDSSKCIEELNRNIESIDYQHSIYSICVYESPTDFANGIELSNGDFAKGAIIYVTFDNEMVYITSWGERQFNPIPLMLSCIISRADTIECLMLEMDGYSLSIEDQRLTSIAVYANYEDALSLCNPPLKIIMDNGEWIITTGVWNSEGSIRVTYDNDKSWFCLHSKGELA